jgi:hypothetical protein
MQDIFRESSLPFSFRLLKGLLGYPAICVRGAING